MSRRGPHGQGGSQRVTGQRIIALFGSTEAQGGGLSAIPGDAEGGFAARGMTRVP